MFSGGGGGGFLLSSNQCPVEAEVRLRGKRQRREPATTPLFVRLSVRLVNPHVHLNKDWVFYLF